MATLGVAHKNNGSHCEDAQENQADPSNIEGSEREEPAIIQTNDKDTRNSETCKEQTGNIRNVQTKPDLSLGKSVKDELSGVFVCGVCSTSFSNKRKLTFHLKKKHNQPNQIPESDLICYVCYKKFSQPYNLQRHISRVHKRDKPFFCDRCGKTFSEKRAMVHHRQYQHSDYRCKLCGISFDEEEGFQSHQCCAIFIEGSEKPYGCKMCKRWFGNGSKLHLHVKTHSFIEEDLKLQKHYTCGVCTEVFNNRKSFNDHTKVHKKEHPHESKMHPDALYYLPQKIEIKKIDSENGMIMVECDVCGKNLSINSIQKHKKIHNGELNMSNCSICGKVFSTSHNRKRHMKTVHMNERSFCCEYCGKLFSEKRTMTFHVYSRHARNACASCGLSFENESRLQKHDCLALCHDRGAKKTGYGCKKCEKYFVHRFQLRRHMEKHLNMDNSSKVISAKSKRLIEKLTAEQTVMKDDIIERNTEKDGFQKIDTEDLRGRDGILYCEICKAMFASEEDFQHHQLWHEDVSLDTD
ncbi:zinc finger protein OZF-like [Ostrea edulis]|uniref:zinc finger protein OZF-like n=1 Tax=Ostrea edulis TaxID=37623 RepID=UPI0024AFCF81|nr:zinc finger protein OZF-like [Ostrea edulis]